MTSFKELGIQVESQSFTGDKIKIDRVLNREIVVQRFRIVDSRFEGKGNGKCLHLQITLSGNVHVVFTGSGCLMDTIQKVPMSAFPFTTTIVRENERLVFT